MRHSTNFWNLRSRRSIAAMGLCLAVSICVLACLFLPGKSRGSLEFITWVRRGERFVGRQHGSTAYGVVARFTHADPARYLRQSARKNAEALFDSGDLVSLTFLVPNLTARLPQIRDRCRPNSRCVLWRASGDYLNIFVRPADAEYWLTDFCLITNRVESWDLRKFAGDTEGAEFRLSDGSLVDLCTCSKWVNENIASGCSAGLAIENRAAGDPVYHAVAKR